MIRPICRMGNPVLRDTASPVALSSLDSAEFNQLIQDMQDSMKHYGGIGIAAPQIGVSQQIALIELPASSRYGSNNELPLTVFINPKIEYLTDEEQGFWEGCLSVPGLRGWIERPKKVRVSYYDQQGNPRSIEAEGFLATVLQHELDHLFGRLYIDRLKDPRLLTFQEEFDMFVQNQKSID